ncbi:MAG: nifR3 family TIM-barrel protein [Rhodothermales bacterium]|jgi:nifR3 family TIM-barrel protein
MGRGFWADLKPPIMTLAPMAGVTDTAFRRIVSKYGKPDACFTEFVSCSGLCSAGRERLLPDLWFDDSERPVVAQIFGPEPDEFEKVAALCVELGFDGIDINTGCPDKNVEKQRAGASLIKDPPRIKAIVAATKAGAGDLPVSVKTRIGYDRPQTEEWIGHLLETEPAAITIHARTREEMSKVPARWEEIEKAVAVRDRAGSDAYIFGNGDVMSIQHGRELCERTGADGMMLGRAIYGNPWLFNPDVERGELHWRVRLDVLLEHARLYQEVYGGVKHFAVLRKYFKSYVAGLPEAKALRAALMDTHTIDDVERIVADYIKQTPEDAE